MRIRPAARSLCRQSYRVDGVAFVVVVYPASATAADLARPDLAFRVEGLGVVEVRPVRDAVPAPPPLRVVG